MPSRPKSPRPCKHEFESRWKCQGQRLVVSAGVLIMDKMEGYELGCPCECHLEDRSE